MIAAEKAWQAAVRPAAVLRDVERRLVAAGAVTELRQLHGLSAQEEAVLVWLELHEPLTYEDVQNDVEFSVTRDGYNAAVPQRMSTDSSTSGRRNPSHDSETVAA